MSFASPEMHACCAARAPYDDAVCLKPERRGHIARLRPGVEASRRRLRPLQHFRLLDATLRDGATR